MTTKTITLYTFMEDLGDGSAACRTFSSDKLRQKWIAKQEAEGRLDVRLCEDDDGTITVKIKDGKVIAEDDKDADEEVEA